MGVGQLVGRGVVVPAALVAESVSVRTTPFDDGVELTVRGSIMDSVKVFHDLRTHADGSVVRLTVLASMRFWNRSGSPDFEVRRRLRLVPGTYRVVYDDGQSTADVTTITV